MKCSMRNKQWKITILYSHVRYFSINKSLDLFPEKISPWTKNITSRYIIIFN
jgi:hypothetical protein